MSATHAQKLQRDRQRYRDNLESCRARGRAFYATNRSSILATQRRRRLTYTRDDLDRLAVYQREWRKTNREQLKAGRRACYARDPEKEKVKQRTRYLRYREKRLKRMKQQRDSRLVTEALRNNCEYTPKEAKPLKAYKPRTHLRKETSEKPKKAEPTPYVPRPSLRPYKERHPAPHPSSLVEMLPVPVKKDLAFCHGTMMLVWRFVITACLFTAIAQEVVFGTTQSL